MGHAAWAVLPLDSLALQSSTQMYTLAMASTWDVNNEKFFSLTTKKQARGLLGVEVRWVR